MYWERKLYIFTIAFILGIFLTFGIHPIAPVNLLALLTISIFIIGGVIAFISYKKYGFFKILPILLLFYLFPFFLGITLTHNSFNINKKGHILQITKGKPEIKATVRGYIYREPEYYEDKVKVFIKPLRISINNKKSQKVKYGKILLNYHFKKGRFPRYLKYGHYITFTGVLQRPQQETNPGGFNYRRFLATKGVYYTIYFRDDKNIQPDEIIKKNPLFAFSLYLKDKFLDTIRKTVPYPESAFLGGITLGLRYGLEGVRAHTSDTYQIKDDFKRAGVNHVLAVSGLHVTILTAFFIGLFSLFGMSRRIYPLITIVFLVIFAIITGGRPSTLRAVIMNSFILVFWAFSKQGIRGSVEIGITLAALLILLVNPLLLRAASFTLSFGAVLSLVLITPFLDDIFKKYLIGYTFWTFFFLLLLFPVLLIIYKSAFFSSIFLWIFLIVSAILLYLSVKFEERTKLPYPQYRKLPGWLISFISAQFAIQLGMMIPLASYYFGRYPIAGMYANYLAIPLIGVNVQIGMIAAIFSLIPVVGIYFALLLNAGNFLFLKLFIISAHWFSTAFPYPYVEKLSFSMLLYYFIVLFIVINFPYIKEKYFDYKYYITLYKQKNEKKKYHRIKYIPHLLIALFLLLTIILAVPKNKRNDLDITFFSLSKGNVVYIKTMKGKDILINAGKYTRYKTKEWDEADRVIMSSLMHYGIKKIDKFILTDYSDDNFSAAPTILGQYPVKKVFLPTNVENIPNLSYEQFLRSTSDSYILNHATAYWVKDSYLRGKVVSNTLINRNIPIVVVKAGKYIYKETVKVGKIEKIFEIYALSPEKKATDDYFNDNLVIKVDYTEKKNNIEFFRKQFVICGAINRDITQNLLGYKKYLRNVDVFVAPNRFLYDKPLEKVLSMAKPVDFLFHLSFYSYKKDMDSLNRYYGFLKDYGTNYFDLASGYVRYRIDNSQLKRTSVRNNISNDLVDYTYEF